MSKSGTMTPGFGDMVTDAKGRLTKYWPLHSGQWDLIQSPARFLLASAGTGGGKTSFGPVWILNETRKILASNRDLKKNPIKGLIVAPTYQVLQRATLPELVKAFADTELEGVITKPSATVYVLPANMGEIWCLSAERPQGLEGGQFDWAWIDEGGQIRYDSWIAIQGRLGLRKGRALITTTPYARNWLYSKFYMLARAGDPDYFVKSWRSCDNPAYPLSEFERAQKTMSAQRFAMRYCGEFQKMAGLVYPNLDRCLDNFAKVPGKGKHVGGVDWGWAPDPFVALAGTWVMEGEFFGHIFLWYLRYKRHCRISEHARVMPRNVQWFTDQSNPEGISELRAADHAAQPNKITNVALGIDSVIERIMSGTLHIHPSLVSLMREGEEYRWPEEEDELIGAQPIGTHHALDALRYLLANIDRRRMMEAWKYDDQDEEKEAA